MGNDDRRIKPVPALQIDDIKPGFRAALGEIDHDDLRRPGPAAPAADMLFIAGERLVEQRSVEPLRQWRGRRNRSLGHFGRIMLDQPCLRLGKSRTCEALVSQNRLHHGRGCGITGAGSENDFGLCRSRRSKCRDAQQRIDCVSIHSESGPYSLHKWLFTVKAPGCKTPREPPSRNRTAPSCALRTNLEHIIS